MHRTKNRTATRHQEQGISLIFAAVGLVIVLGISALAIDLAFLYVARNEAQRAADSAALAGAKYFADSGCTAKLDCSAEQAKATQQAIDIGQQNAIAGNAVSIANSDISFSPAGLLTQDPRVTVTVHADSLPTLFARILRINSVKVSATATAEAYSASGPSNLPLCVTCVKPFLIPNCDPVNTAPQNPNCGGTYGYFFDPNTGQLEHTSVIGSTYNLHSNSAPSQYGLVDVPGLSLTSNVTICNQTALTCGSQLQTINGNRVGEIVGPVETLIHANGTGPNQGQDVLASTTPPFQILAGSGNPLVSANTPITTSDSIVALAVYDGSPLPPGGSTVSIIGFMQVFINYVDHQGSDVPVNVTVLNAAGCGNQTGTCQGSGAISGTGKGLVAIRLVQNP